MRVLAILISLSPLPLLTAAAPAAPEAVSVNIAFSPKAARALSVRPQRLSLQVGYYGAPTSPQVRRRDPMRVADDGSGVILLGEEQARILSARPGVVNVTVRGLDRNRLSWVKRLWVSTSAQSEPYVGGPGALRCTGDEAPLVGPGRHSLSIMCKLESELPPENEDDYDVQGSAPELKY